LSGGLPPLHSVRWGKAPEMSRLVRCIPCHRSGSALPPFGDQRPVTGTPEQQLNQRCSFDELDENLPVHCDETGHNDWEHLRGAWVHLGSHRGDGYFAADWEASDKRVPSSAARRWLAAYDVFTQGEYCLLCGWCRPPPTTGALCGHIAETGHNEWGSVMPGGERVYEGALLECHGCPWPPGTPVSEEWKRVHRHA
jgi:hypothetical protein